MSEPANANDAPTPSEALESIDTALRHEEALRSRTEGLTWMVWGLVFAPLVLVWEAVGSLYPGAYDALPAAVVYNLWVPWVLMGALATWALWRTAAVVAPALEDRPQAGVRVTLGYVGFAALIWATVWLTGARLTADNVALLTIGTVWLIFGAWNPFRMTPTGQRVSLAVGALTLVVGLALAVVAVSDPAAGWEGLAAANRVATLVALPTLTLVPFLGGLWQTLRG